jgi:hypothetical protein
MKRIICLSAFAAIVLAGSRAGPAAGVILVDITTTPGDESIIAMNADDYKKAVAAGYWVIGQQAPGPPGATGRWLLCIEIGDIKRQDEDSVIVEAGNGQWAWDDLSGRSPCLTLPRSIQPAIID